MTETSQGDVIVKYDETCAIVELVRPDKLNALTVDMILKLETIAHELDRRSDLTSVILTASGNRAFCVGADINLWASLKPLEMWRFWTRIGHRVFDAWANLRLPVIAAINGHAFGGGLELLATSDIRISVPEATFALPEAGIATCPGWSGTQRLSQQIGSNAVKYLALTGRRIGVEKALELGLIQEISAPDTLLENAQIIAKEIGEKAPVAVQLTKQLINASHGFNIEATLEGMAGALAATTEDAKEGLASFTERRQAHYQGR